jgi:hypothetical protein
VLSPRRKRRDDGAVRSGVVGSADPVS